MNRSRSPLALLALLPVVAALSSCGGSGATPEVAAPTEQTFGSLTTRIVGTATPPVVSAGFNAAVVGVAGATISDISQSYAGRSLANSKIVFYSTRELFDKIYSMNHDGTNLVRLTPSNATASDLEPSYSPDGTKIVFSSTRTVGTYEIYTMNADGTNVTRLTTNVSDDGTPRWSPDGSKIAFQTNRDGNYEIYTMNPDGTAQTRVTNNAAIDALPTWAPDSARLAFSSNRDGNYEIYRMNADGTGQTRMTNNAATEYDPSWSPDGTRIAFYSNRDGNTEIYTMNASGSGLTRITTNTSNDIQPTWSPDSARLNFQSDRDSNYEIYTMNADGTGQTRLTNNDATDFHAEWSGYMRPKYVGTGGSLGTECAGFLVGQQGDENASILIFDTPTVGARAASRIAANTNADTNSPNLIFTITTSTGMTSLKFLNLSQSLIPVTPTLPAGTTGALVLFNASTGNVSSVLPYAANRSASLKPTRAGDSITYSGNFTAIFDGSGKNLAPGGAKSVTLDEKTGKLVRFE